ncbi:MAG: hypothetical protein H8F28_10230 [Fibrella sp.]|nr:hypothetical protein [Armatimonadota bacterium]
MMSLVQDLPQDVQASINAESLFSGKNPQTIVVERLRTSFATTPAIPAHLDPSRSKTMAQWTNDVRSRHGFPDDWGMKPVTLSADDWAVLEAACADMYPGYEGEGTAGEQQHDDRL